MALFDKAHSDALRQTKIEEDGKLLLFQRQKDDQAPWLVYNVHINQKLHVEHEEERALKRSAKETAKKKGLLKK